MVIFLPGRKIGQSDKSPKINGKLQPVCITEYIMIEFQIRYFHQKFPSLCPCHVFKFDNLEITENSCCKETTSTRFNECCIHANPWIKWNAHWYFRGWNFYRFNMECIPGCFKKLQNIMITKIYSWKLNNKSYFIFSENEYRLWSLQNKNQIF